MTLAALGTLDYAICSITLGVSTIIGIYFGCFGGKQKSSKEYLYGAELVLYGMDGSPPVRAVLAVAGALALELKRIDINVMAGEQLKPDFVKINPQHTVPTLNDNGFIIWDSHAIAAYLVGKYGQNDSLYPKDLQQRAIVDQRLHFDSSILFPRVRNIFYPIVILKKTSIPKENADAVLEAYAFLESFLTGHDWLAGDYVSIADLCASANVSTLDAVITVDSKTYPLTVAWLQRCQNLPYYQNLTMLMKVGFSFMKKLIET